MEARFEIIPAHSGDPDQLQAGRLYRDSLETSKGKAAFPTTAALTPLQTTQVMLGQQHAMGSIPAEAEGVEASLGYIVSFRPAWAT